MSPRKNWRVIVSLDDGTNTWVTVCPVREIYGQNGERPNVEDAAGQAVAGFIRSVVRDEDVLRKKWLA